jgi:ribosome-binding protein aMBF1 (putative translation factor)
MAKISHLHRRWSKDADYTNACEALGEEFELSRALIDARPAAGLSQLQLARRMKTSPSYIARIEGRQGPSVNRCSGTVRSGDTHASADRLRTTREALTRRGPVILFAAGSIPACYGHGNRSASC